MKFFEHRHISVQNGCMGMKVRDNTGDFFHGVGGTIYIQSNANLKNRHAHTQEYNPDIQVI